MATGSVCQNHQNEHRDYWYFHRDELEVGQVFRTHSGEVVKLDHRKPGDGTQWVVADWWDGWAYYEATIEPGDLCERIADPTKKGK